MLFLDCIWKYDKHETELTQKADMQQEEEEKDRKRREQEQKERVAKEIENEKVRQIEDWKQDMKTRREKERIHRVKELEEWEEKVKQKKEEESQCQARINERSKRQKQWDAHRAAWLKGEADHLKRWNEWQEKLPRAEADLKNKVAASEQFGKRIAEMRGEIDDMKRRMRDKREGTITPSPPSPLTQGGERWEDTRAG